MKRIISMMLILVVLVALTCVTTFAENTNVTDKEFLFEDLFIDILLEDGPYVGKYDYDELYYHHVDENDPDSEIDWAIIYALENPLPMEAGVVVAGRYIYDTAVGIPFTVDYAIYDAQLNKLIDIEKIDPTKYKDLEKGLEEAKVGYPLGDADLDGGLSVMDATYIQQALTDLCEFKDNDRIIYSENVWIPSEERLKYVSDIDCDGERTVMDATAIQVKLAKT